MANLILSINQLGLTDIYRPGHPTPIEYIFFSNAQETFSRIDYTLGHKPSLKKF